MLFTYMSFYYYITRVVGIVQDCLTMFLKNHLTGFITGILEDASLFGHLYSAQFCTGFLHVTDYMLSSDN